MQRPVQRVWPSVCGCLFSLGGVANGADHATRFSPFLRTACALSRGAGFGTALGLANPARYWRRCVGFLALAGGRRFGDATVRCHAGLVRCRVCGMAFLAEADPWAAAVGRSALASGNRPAWPVGAFLRRNPVGAAGPSKSPLGLSGWARRAPRLVVAGAPRRARTLGRSAACCIFAPQAGGLPRRRTRSGAPPAGVISK